MVSVGDEEHDKPRDNRPGREQVVSRIEYAIGEEQWHELLERAYHRAYR